MRWPGRSLKARRSRIARAALSALGGGAGLGAGSGAADIGSAAEWRWLPSLRGGHLASCVGRRSASRTGQTSTYTASLRCATEPPSRRVRSASLPLWAAPAAPCC